MYTFRTFPLIEELKRAYPRLIILGELNKDIKLIKDEIIETKSAVVVGIAKSNGGSVLESIAINRFNKMRISKLGPEKFDLFIPEQPVFKKSNKPTSSFCNWSMYKILQFVKEKNLNCRLIFIHVNLSDFEKALTEICNY
jgi:pyrrolidone-carboxylate peptidase